MEQFICFHRNYLKFKGGVKYKITKITSKHFFVGSTKISRHLSELFWTGDVIRQNKN